MRDIAYKNYRNSHDIHGTALYPAVMIAPVQKDLLSEIINRNKKIKIIDPFHGSGTALYEASRLSDNIQLYGCDINPLANLITKVKLQGVSKNIENDIESLKDSLRDYEGQLHDFTNIHKWFRDDIIFELSKIRSAILKIEDKFNRMFFWYMLLNIIRKYSNTRSSTYKLHTKQENNITKIENNLISDYFSSIEKCYKLFLNNYNSFTLVKGDAIEYLRNIKDNEFDICITSPPYGENATTVPYGQFSILPLLWIDSKDLDLEGWELDSFSIIDSKSLGGPYQKTDKREKDFIELIPFINNISEYKHRKVIRFFSGYFEFLDQISRVTNSEIVMTLGNRTVDGVCINLTKITIQFLKDKGYKEKEMAKREIVSKRIPKRVSTVKNSSVSSMNEEYVIVMQRL